MLIINGLRTKVQSVDKITNQANWGGIHKSIHRALRFWVGARGEGACICLVLFPQHDFYWEFMGGVR